jgi:hypothetical protein
MRIAHRVNRGLQLLAKVQRREALGDADTPDLLRAASYLADGIGGRTPDSPKTIHRYRPSRYLGGALSLLNFARPRMQELIELGYRDVMHHDCVKSKCVLPDGMQGGEG